MLTFKFSFADGTIIRLNWANDAGKGEIIAETVQVFESRTKLANLKGTNGKRYFRKANVLPNRRFTLDVYFEGKVLKSTIAGLEFAPSALNDSEFIYQFMTSYLNECLDTRFDLALESVQMN